MRPAQHCAWATRNIYLDSPGIDVAQQSALKSDAGFQRDIVGMMQLGTIKSLRQRGAVFWQCNNALAGITAELAGKTGARYSDVRQELIAGFLPGVRLVPAHTMMVGLMQEKGFTYERV